MIHVALWGWSSSPLSIYAWGWDEVTSAVIPNIPVKHGTGRYSVKAAYFYRSELTVNQRIQAHNGKGLTHFLTVALDDGLQAKRDSFGKRKIGKG